MRKAFALALGLRYVPRRLAYASRPLRTFASLDAHLQVHLGLGGKPRSGLRPHSLNRAASTCCGLRTSSGRLTRSRYNAWRCGAPQQPSHSATAPSIARSRVSEAMACRQRHALAASARHCGVHGRTKCFGWPLGFGRKALREYSGRWDPLRH